MIMIDPARMPSAAGGSAAAPAAAARMANLYVPCLFVRAQIDVDDAACVGIIHLIDAGLVDFVEALEAPPEKIRVVAHADA